MKNIQREDIHLVARYSNLEEQPTAKALEKYVYPNTKRWKQFLRILLLTFGVGFTVLGIIFFFAYNWADLHKFIKLGLIEGLVLVTTGIALHPRFNTDTRNILLTGSAVLIGVLFAVFGQVYQTGANAYDFFLAWTVFITLWVLVSNFTPLWLIFLCLINVSLYLYGQQVAADWSATWHSAVLFLVNAFSLFLCIIWQRYRANRHIPPYFTNSISLAAVVFASNAVITGIFENDSHNLAFLLPLIGILYAIGFWHSVKHSSGFYYSILSFSVITMLCAALLKSFDNQYIYLTMSIFITTSVIWTIYQVIKLQKRHYHGK